MSDPLQVGFVVEGPTDRIVLEAITACLLGGREFVAEQLSPELSEAFGALTGGGWGAVYKWCRQAAGQTGGRLRDNPLLDRLDLLIVHVDADVAGKSYADYAWIAASYDQPGDLPCRRPCPPASASTDPLRNVVLGWMGETVVPPKAVICTPSMSTETWVLVALFPENAVAASPAVECYANPEAQLQRQPKARRVKKQPGRYREIVREVARQWPHVRRLCTEGERFSAELLAGLP
jgi:hypothetical protein